VTSDQGQLHQLLDFAVDIGRGAGQITLDYFKKAPETSTKSDGSFVTIADREAESYLRRRILEQFPDDGILGEEEGERGGTSGHRWIIDPIDGTFSFVHGVPFYGVLIALEIQNELAVGVINTPAVDEIVYAANGIGCFLNGKPARVSTAARLDDALLLCTDFSACERYGFGKATEVLQSKAKTSRTWGDCYGYVLVATGRADVMFDPVMNVWDCAALLPILEEAGGTFTDFRGARTATGGNAIATNGLLFDEVMTIVRDNESA
jgi:histidinol phosphatase-like enzyme (inositol monophosphatase family)